jgi:methylmalonyl-CoA/ethylmalonyl-CoA epimerase
MIKKIDHIAIAVRNLDEALKLYDTLFGARPSKIEIIPQQGVKAALLPMGQGSSSYLPGSR